jgi:hypothetical protein
MGARAIRSMEYNAVKTTVRLRSLVLIFFYLPTPGFIKAERIGEAHHCRYQFLKCSSTCSKSFWKTCFVRFGTGLLKQKKRLKRHQSPSALMEAGRSHIFVRNPLIAYLVT